jgi:hypothetical protein
MQSQGSGFEYHFENGIHHFTVAKAQPAAVDDFLRQFQMIFDETPPQDVILLLTDLRPDGIPPILYTVSALKEFFARQSQPRHFKSAFLYRRGTLVHLLPTFFNMTRQRATRRFFLDDEDAEAVRWLLAEE